MYTLSQRFFKGKLQNSSLRRKGYLRSTYIFKKNQLKLVRYCSTINLSEQKAPYFNTMGWTEEQMSVLGTYKGIVVLSFYVYILTKKKATLPHQTYRKLLRVTQVYL